MNSTEQLAADVASLKSQLKIMSASVDNLLAGHFLAAAQRHATSEILRQIVLACATTSEGRSFAEGFVKAIDDLARQNLNDFLAEVSDDAPAVAGYIQRLLAQRGTLPQFITSAGDPTT